MHTELAIPNFEAASDSTLSLVEAQLQQLDLGHISQTIQQGNLLSSEEARAIAHLPIAYFPALIALLRKRQSLPARQVRPVFFIPLTTLIEQRGMQHATNAAQGILSTLSDSVLPSGIIHLAIDRWHGKVSYLQIIEVLKEIIDTTRDIEITPLAPSSNELEQIWTSEAKLLPLKQFFCESFFARFKAIGITSLEGGSALPVIERAALNGFTFSFGQNMLNDKQAFVEEELIERTAWLIEQFPSSHLLTSWFPWAPLQKSNRSVMFTSVQVLRAIALGRLLLNPKCSVRAPMSLLSSEYCELAFLFGCNDFGYAAVDNHTAHHLGIMPLSDFEPQLRQEKISAKIFGKREYYL